MNIVRDDDDDFDFASSSSVFEDFEEDEIEFALSSPCAVGYPLLGHWTEAATIDRFWFRGLGPKRSWRRICQYSFIVLIIN